jgi:hypothetical protein
MWIISMIKLRSTLISGNFMKKDMHNDNWILKPNNDHIQKQRKLLRPKDRFIHVDYIDDQTKEHFNMWKLYGERHAQWQLNFKTKHMIIFQKQRKRLCIILRQRIDSFMWIISIIKPKSTLISGNFMEKGMHNE